MSLCQNGKALTLSSMTIQTACSSSLICLHEACQALRSGECSTALVGGTSLIWGPTMTDAMTKNMVLSPSGISHTFDVEADGYGRGEGINCIYLKPLRHALRDNDAIRAVIRSTVTNHDGKTPNFSQPCPISQEKLIRHAYQVARIDAIHETPVFECHGTGTAVGDVIEASVVAKMTQGEATYITAVSILYLQSCLQQNLSLMLYIRSNQMSVTLRVPQA